MTLATPLLIRFADRSPRIDPTAFVAPTASVIGDVAIGPECCILFGVVLRGDVTTIRIGARSNVQDRVVVSGSPHRPGTDIGEAVTIGGGSILHGCRIESGAFVGMDCVVMDGTVVGERAMLAAGTLLPRGQIVPAGELWAGRPAKSVRLLHEDERAMMRTAIDGYAGLASSYRGDTVSML